MEITAYNTNDLAAKVYESIFHHGITENSRNGTVMRIPEPVTIRLLHPWERVNLCPVRDANPFFHLIEAIAMLAPFNSVRLLQHFAKPIAQYSDNGTDFNAFYGSRAIHKWGNQVQQVIAMLNKDPNTRRAVVNLWDPRDLWTRSKDYACNLQLMFWNCDTELAMTSTNRSNDAILGGVTGANIVQLSMFHEYVAASLGRPMGSWYHFSNNLHIYLDQEKWPKVRKAPPVTGPYPETRPLFSHPTERGTFDTDTEHICTDMLNRVDNLETLDHPYPSSFIDEVVRPMFNVWQYHKSDDDISALMKCEFILAEDWRTACQNWLNRRINPVKP
jgi:hypothetical protein